MFKYLIKANVGGWWLSVGIWFKGKPFSLGRHVFLGTREYWLRVFWLEFTITELPF